MREEDYHIKLFKRFIKTLPDFSLREPEFLVRDNSKSKILRLHVSLDVNWTGHDDNPYDIKMSDDDCCRNWLETVMKNKSFQTYWKTLKFDSFDELEVKLAVFGV